MSTLVTLWLVPISLLYFLADARFMTIASHWLSMSSSKDSLRESHSHAFRSMTSLKMSDFVPGCLR